MRHIGFDFLDERNDHVETCRTKSILALAVLNNDNHDLEANNGEDKELHGYLLICCLIYNKVGSDVK